MKTLFIISTITILLFGTLINAEDNMLDRGGKFGNKIFQTQISPPLVSHDETNNNRSNCRSHVWFQPVMRGRWWNYWLVKRVKAYAYTRTTYGTATRNCGIPFRAKSTFIDLILTDRWSHREALAFHSYRSLGSSRLNNTDFIRVNGRDLSSFSNVGSNILSYHVADYGWHIARETIVYRWK